MAVENWDRPEKIALAILTSGYVLLNMFMLSETFENYGFRKAGPRFSSNDAALMRADIVYLKHDNLLLREEMRRQQLQIDRLEGHKPHSYLEDHTYLKSFDTFLLSEDKQDG